MSIKPNLPPMKGSDSNSFPLEARKNEGAILKNITPSFSEPKVRASREKITSNMTAFIGGKLGFNPLHFFWDFFCIGSIIGIWPRFIEPYLLHTTKLKLKIPDLPEGLKDLKILQFSDLHLNSSMPQFYINKLTRRIKKLKPDLIVFTGDFICHSFLEDEKRLENFLSSLHAPYGCYAIFGNHDYEKGVSLSDSGDYDILEKSHSSLFRGFRRFFKKSLLNKSMATRVHEIQFHKGLVNLLQKTPFSLLHNETKQIPIRGCTLNVCGLGEYMLGKSLPEKAFANYDTRYPGIVLVHNPDALVLLKDYPGQIALSGHTHGMQVNLPWFRYKFTLLENQRLARGLVLVDGKKAYVNRGISGTIPFRWFSTPELLLLTLINK